MTQRKKYSIGVDIGGTFTDFVITDADGERAVVKAPTNKAEPDEGVFECLNRYAGEAGLALDELLGQTEVFVHGTTIATNTVIQRSGPVVGLLCTRGHRDVPALRDGFKPNRYDLHMQPPDPFVPRLLRQSVDERVVYDGSVIRPLDREDLERAVATLLERDAASIAIAFLWSVRNPAHEIAARDYLAAVASEVPVTMSHEVRPSLGEWPRTSATVLSAYVRPMISEYLRKLELRLQEAGYERPLLIMQSNGGTSTIAEIERCPVTALASGPAAGPAAGLDVASQFDEADVLTVDMGGTSFDISLVAEGEALTSTELQVDDQPIGVPALEVHSIGAGGGSIAWVDTGGALRIGPQSAGSTPGPACYQKGGLESTVSDANLVLGFLDEANPLGGNLVVSRSHAEEAITRAVAEPLGLDVLDAAWAIFTVVNHNMVEAMKAHSVQRGIDPRRYALIVGGGAGPIHGSSLARILGIDRAIIPPEAGVLCAFGMVQTSIRHDYVRALPQRGETLDLQAVNAAFDEMEEAALTALEAEGFDQETVVLRRSVDMLYRNQVKELEIPVPRGPLDEGALAAVCEEFHATHEKRYTYAIREAPLDFYHWRLAAYARVNPPTGEKEAEPEPGVAAESARKGTRPVYFGEGGMLDTAIYDGDRLSPGMELDGPAVLERASTTIVVLPEQRLSVTAGGAVAIETQGTADDRHSGSGDGALTASALAD